MLPWAYLVTVGLLVFASGSFFFALAESSLSALGKARMRHVAQERHGAKVARLLEKPAELLATIALGNTVTTSAMIAFALWPVLLGLWPALWTLIAVSLVILIGCEILPKTLAVRAPELWAARVSGPMLFLRETTGWLQRLFERF